MRSGEGAALNKQDQVDNTILSHDNFRNLALEKNTLPHISHVYKQDERIYYTCTDRQTIPMNSKSGLDQKERHTVKHKVRYNREHPVLSLGYPLP